MSNLHSALSGLAERITKHSNTIATEEASKTSIVLPFLQALGYDVFNPSEVIPEFTADAVGKKGEKVDYAIRIGDEISLLIECKGLSTSLEKKHLSQLYRYFSVTKAKFALLTNGRFFEFYSDLDEENKLDLRPFFTLDLLDLNSRMISELSKFEKSSFDAERILKNAERLKYVGSIKKFISAQLDEPSEQLVKLIASVVHEGRVSPTVKENISVATKVAFNEFIRESVQAKLANALENSTGEDAEATVEDCENEGIETTQDEIEGMLTIKAIVRDIIGADRVGLRDSKSYCAILVDDNNRKPLARLHFNRKQWYLGLFDTEKEERVPISSLSEMFSHAERLRTTAERYRET